MKNQSKIICMVLSAFILLCSTSPIMALTGETNVALQFMDGVNTVGIKASYYNSSLGVPEAVFDGKSDDGNGMNKWYVPQSDSNGAWINVDLNSVCTIGSMKVYSGFANNTTTSDKLLNYDIYYSDKAVSDPSSNDEYTLLTSVIADNGLYEIDLNTVSARNVKIVSKNSTAFRIREIEIFGIFGDDLGEQDAPEINLLTPKNDSRIQYGSTVEISAVATIRNGAISNVIFYCDESILNVDVNSQDTEYSCKFIPSVGSHTIKASATSDKGVTSYSQEITINVTDNILPSITLENDINDKVYSPFERITLTAEASDSDGPVQSVQFFNFGEPITEQTKGNGDGTYSAVIVGEPGYYRITAQVTDSAGESVMSSSVDFKVAYTNVAAGITPTSSQNEKGSDLTSSLASLTDGIINVSPLGGSKYYLKNINSAYIEFDFGNQQDIMGGMVCSGDMKNFSTNFNDIAENFHYQYYNGEGWIDILESNVSGNTSNAVYTEFPTKITTEKIRIVFTDITALRITEIELYTNNDFIITSTENSEFERAKPYSVSRTVKNTTTEDSEGVMIMALYDHDNLISLDISETKVIEAGAQQSFSTEIDIPDNALNNSYIKLMMFENFDSLKPLMKSETIIADELSGKLAVSSVFGDGMVLQRDKPIHVWGKGLDGDTITVELNNQSVQTTVQNGIWEVYLEPETAGGPYTVSIAGQYESKKINDVLIGEVWLCSGQSNMNMSLAWAEGGAASNEILTADYPEIRAFRASVSESSEPQFSVDSRYWEQASPSTVGYWSAVAYYFAKELHQELDVPVGIIVSALGGTDIQTWISEEGIASVESLVTTDRQTSSIYYNNAIAPVAGYTLKGFVWYQGENNARITNSEVFKYEQFQTALIHDWRNKFADDSLPFYITQLPNMIRESSPVWQYLREQQLFAATHVTNTGMAVTIDVGDPLDIHPHNKAPVGHRLALLALDNTYGKEVVSSGPVFMGAEFEGEKVILHFDTEDLVLNDDKLYSGFVICGEDKVFYHAKAQVSGSDIILSNENVNKPIAARYAFANNPYVTLFNSEGLPASPFRTDSFGIDEAKMPDGSEDLSAAQ